VPRTQAQRPSHFTTHNHENTQIEPYLFFHGRCEEAMSFYESALGAKRVMLMRFNESPEPPPPGMTPENWGQKIMHAAIQVGGAFIMASDGCEQGASFSGFSLSVTLPDQAACEKCSPPSAKGAKSPCRWAKPSGPPASAWSLTGSASAG
jgi:PhnB protein